jgi:hypothetical protein
MVGSGVTQQQRSVLVTRQTTSQGDKKKSGAATSNSNTGVKSKEAEVVPLTRAELSHHGVTCDAAAWRQQWARECKALANKRQRRYARSRGHANGTMQ